MSRLDLNLAASQPAFLGGYTYEGLGTKALSPTTSDLDDRAALTFALWRAATAVVINAQIMMATQDAKTSVCLVQGGLILEAKNKLNLGLLRSMVRDTAVVPVKEAEQITPDGSFAASLVKLGRWIERIEVGRTIELMAGSETFVLWAHKGRFQLCEGGDLLALRAAIGAAAKDGAPIKGRYNDAPNGSSDKLLAQISLFGDDGQWALHDCSVSSSILKSKNIEVAAAVIAFVERLNNWRMGQPADVTLFGQDGKAALRVVATNENATIVEKL